MPSNRVINEAINTAINIGDVIYNGFHFPPTSLVKLQIVPVYTIDQRTVKYRRYILTVSAILLPLDLPQAATYFQHNSDQTITTDYNMNDVRVRLQEARKPLQANLLGFGRIAVNSSFSAEADLLYGPKPILLSCHPVAKNKAMQIEWQCEFHIAECSKDLVTGVATFTLGNVADFSWDANFNINSHGLSQRTISGVLEIPVFASANVINRTADEFRNLLNIPRLPNFRRTQNYHVDKDKRTIHWFVTDEEIPSDNPFMPNMVNMQVRQHVSSSLASGGFRQWHGALNGTITVAHGVNKVYAWLAFLTVLRTRLDNLGLGYAGNEQNGPGQIPNYPGSAEHKRAIKDKQKPGTLKYIDSISIDDDIYGRDVHFQVSYFFNTSLAGLIRASGLWQPIAGTDWTAWQTSMNSVFGIRGYANLGLNTSDDVIVDICQPQTPAINGYSFIPGEVGGPSEEPERIKNKLPPPENSWLDFKNDMTLDENPGHVWHKPLSPSVNVNVSDDGTISDTEQKLPFSTTYESAHDIPIKRGPGSYYVNMKGYGVRLGYHVNPPNLKTIGGVEAVPVHRRIMANSVISIDSEGNPVYCCGWDIWYRLRTVPQNLTNNSEATEQSRV